MKQHFKRKTFTQWEDYSVATKLDMQRLSSLVRKHRGSRGLRETAKEIGSISPSTLSRVENGKMMPDMETFLALCDWLEIPPAELFKTTNDSDLDTPEKLSIQLRADKNLDPAIANALASLVKAAYKDLSESDS
ncbi:MAG: helix-turn-helix transcriptional regulator [Cyanobacteria bacterium J06560_5]